MYADMYEKSIHIMRLFIYDLSYLIPNSLYAIYDKSYVMCMVHSFYAIVNVLYVKVVCNIPVVLSVV